MEAEKAGGPMLVAVLEDLREKIDGLVARDIERDATLKQLLSAFPGTDTEGHRRYHQAVIERMELRNKIVREALVKAAGSGAIIGGGWVAYALWQAFKVTVKQ